MFYYREGNITTRLNNNRFFKKLQLSTRQQAQLNHKRIVFTWVGHPQSTHLLSFQASFQQNHQQSGMFYYREGNKTRSLKKKQIFKKLQLSIQKQAQFHRKRHIHLGSMPTVQEDINNKVGFLDRLLTNCFSCEEEVNNETMKQCSNNEHTPNLHIL